MSSSISGVNQANLYGQLASGVKLRTAADGAAELGIAEKENIQTRGYEVGSNNAQSGKEVANISDGALSSITDNLQRIRELALSSMNTATTTDSDRAAYQQEIEQLKQGIADTAEQTTYNTKRLLDGSNTEFQLATDANGGSASVTTVNATLEALGIADFDVTGDFSLDTIDNALKIVSDARGTLGAETNGLDYLQNYNSTASYQHTASASRLEDLDYPQAVEEKKKQETLQQYALLMQKKKQEDEARKSSMFFT